jgi:hypothetical protein
MEHTAVSLREEGRAEGLLVYLGKILVDALGLLIAGQIFFLDQHLDAGLDFLRTEEMK